MAIKIISTNDGVVTATIDEERAFSALIPSQAMVERITRSEIRNYLEHEYRKNHPGSSYISGLDYTIQQAVGTYVHEAVERQIDIITKRAISQTASSMRRSNKYTELRELIAAALMDEERKEANDAE